MSKQDIKQKMTPMQKQYHEIKKNYTDTILFFRLGDFYEMFYDDALIASKILQITLTSRNTGELKKIPMCGIPFHAADNYIAKLVNNGHKVAICEQIEDPKTAKKLVKRDVIQVITPGTVVDSNMLNQKSNNYLMSIFIENNTAGISTIDLSTGEFIVTENKDVDFASFIENELTRLNPSEIIIPEKAISEHNILKKILNHFPNLLINKYYDWVFEVQYSTNKLLDLYSIKSLEGFGINKKSHIISSAGSIIHYIQETQKQTINHIDNIKYYSNSDFMELDNATIRNLELVQNQFDNTAQYSLFSILDYTKTPQGARLLKKRILEPLTDKKHITQRLNYIDFFHLNNDIKDKIRELLNKIQDIERICSRISFFRANPRELISLKNSLIHSIKIKKIIEKFNPLIDLSKQIPYLKEIIDKIDKSINDEPPLLLSAGNIIKTGYNSELDKLRKVQNEGKELIANMQKQEIERTGINSLKIKYNKVFGYYIEITKSNLNLVPDDYNRKQTLVNAERFTFPALQEYEELILSATEKITILEEQLFKDILNFIISNITDIKKTGKIIAQIDFYTTIAECAFINNYVKPIISNNGKISIKNGRHPVIEQTVNEEPFIPNDTILDNDENSILIITGPNMAGKSTFLRQIALITLMAQMGSFVPAEKAEISIVDKIFTRIGASDNLAKGQSTFLVEMNETANILNNATDKSLIIMDEIGRGTSTYDGLSIAWAIIEYIFDKSKIGAKTLFATHYHELTQLGTKKGIKNYNILVREWNDDIVFLRKVTSGTADKSYGIQVAKLAGIPKDVIERSKVILLDLETDNVKDVIISQSNMDDNKNDQLGLFKVNTINIVESEILNILKDTNLNTLTPIEALNILNTIKEKLDLQKKEK